MSRNQTFYLSGVNGEMNRTAQFMKNFGAFLKHIDLVIERVDTYIEDKDSYEEDISNGQLRMCHVLRYIFKRISSNNELKLLTVD